MIQTIPVVAESYQTTVRDLGQTYDVYYESEEEERAYIAEYLFSLDASSYSDDHDGRKFAYKPTISLNGIGGTGSKYMFQDDVETENEMIIEKYVTFLEAGHFEDDFLEASYVAVHFAKDILASRNLAYLFNDKGSYDYSDFVELNQGYIVTIIEDLFEAADVEFDYWISDNSVCSSIDGEKYKILTNSTLVSYEKGYTYNSHGDIYVIVSESDDVDDYLEAFKENHGHHSAETTYGELYSKRKNQYEYIEPVATESVFLDMLTSGSAEMNAVNHLYNKGMINGTGDTTFSPDALLTREQMAKIAVAVYEKTNGPIVLDGTETLSYADSEEIAPWAETYVIKASKANLMNGYGKNEEGVEIYGPKDTVTLQQVQIITVRLFDIVPQEAIDEADGNWLAISALYDITYRTYFEIHEGIDPASTEPATRAQAAVILDEGVRVFVD